MELHKRYLTWIDVEELSIQLAATIQRAEQEYDVLLGIARGGTIPATLLAQALEHGMVLTAHLRRYRADETDSLTMPRIVAFPPAELLAGKRVLIIDEVHDHGHSIIRAKQEAEQCDPLLVHTAVLHFKPLRNVYELFKPTYFAQETSEWIVYPWEVFASKVAAHHASR